MKKFIIKLTLFSLTFIVFILALGLGLPATPKDSKSLLFAKIKKDSLLKNTPSPRIIFVGGSNLSFGLNSQTIKDSLDLNPINTTIHAGIGLEYMMDNTLQYVNEGDIVVVAAEYQHFFGNFVYGGEELLRLITDVRYAKLKINQIKNIYKFFPKLAFSRINPFNYIFVRESDIYSVNSFNEYGDVYTHWGMEQEKIKPNLGINDDYNPNTIGLINDFRIDLKKKNASLFLTYPGFQASSFDNNIKQIKKVENELISSGFELLGYPERYRINDSLMFNTPYHLSKEGVDIRTQLLIEDFKKINY